MGIKTKIGWCDSTWNPITGCEHGCDYCYARNMAKRFEGWDDSENGTWRCVMDGTGLHAILELDGLQAKTQKDGKVVPAPYPLGFTPTLHRYRLDEPQKWKEHKNIFVCSMADMFGKWVPDEWITEVFNACDQASWHRYLFLTKNPERYNQLYEKDLMPKGIHAWNKWYGCTITKADEAFFYIDDDAMGIDHYGFLSIEPLHGDFPVNDNLRNMGIRWVIIGAETGNRKGKVVPQEEWIKHLLESCDRSKIPVFMKNSLKPYWKGQLRQELPWEKK